MNVNLFGKFIGLLVVVMLFIPGVVLAQDPPWEDPVATGRTQPVYIVDATINGIQIDVANDWIGIFDETLVVGKDQIDALPAANPITSYLEYTPPGSEPLPGARTGFPMSFKIWDASTGQELDAEITQVVTGEAVFSEGTIVAVRINAVSQVQQYTLTMAVDPAGGGTTDPAVGPHDYAEGTEVPVTATANPGWQFVNWTGEVADANSEQTTVTMNDHKTVTANFTQVQYTLTMAVDPAGGGTTDPAVGPHVYVEGSEVPVTATPAAGSQFVNWSGDVADVNNPSTMVTVDGNKTVTANFELIPPTEYTLTMAVNPAGGGTTDPAVGPHDYAEGTEVPVTATANPGWQFVNWTGEVADANSEQTTVTMNDHKTVTANFTQVQYTLTMAANPAGGGTTDPAVGPHDYAEGTEVPITATANPGWQFVNWTGEVADANSEQTTVTMNDHKTVTANFMQGVPGLEHFTWVVDPTGRTQPVYISDALLDGLQLQPGDEVGVFDGELLVGAAEILTLPMADPITVYLTYTPPGGDPLPGAQDGNEMLFRVWDQSADREECADTLEVISGEPIFAESAIVALSLIAPCEEFILTMAVDPAGGGTTDPAVGPHVYVEGSEVPVTATPTAGWQFVNWTGDVADVNSPSTMVTVDGNKTVTANFELIPPTEYTLTMAVNPAGGGTTDPAVGPHVYVEGSEVPVTATPTAGWQFVNWTGDVADVNSPSTTVTVDGNKTVTANFELIPPTEYTLTMAVNPAGGGTTDPAVGPHGYVEGTEVPVTATPTAGWQFVNWSGDVADVNSPSTMVTVDGNKTVTANFELIPPTEYTLTMAVNPAGGGTTDPAVGPHGYVEGTEVPVTATPTAGWQFVNWSGDVADVNSPSTMVTVDGNKTVTANFELIPPTEYTLTMAVNPAGGGTTDPAVGPHGYVEGTEVPVTATPTAGWQFVNWSGDVADVNSPSTMVTVDGNKTVTANFELIPPTEYTLTMAVNPAGGGTTDPAVGPHVYVEGTEVPVTATPTAGWQFMNWTGDVADVNSPSTTVTVDGNKTVTANFEELPPGLEHFTWVVDPTGRTQPVYITDALLDGLQLQQGDEVGVFDGDLLVGAAKIETFPMADPITVYLVYTPPGGDPLPGAQDGNDMLFRVWDQSADREECADISEVISGEPIFAESAIVALSLVAPCEIPPTEYTLTMAVNPAGGGTTDPAVGPHVYVEGTEVPVTATPAAGWQFVNWSGDVADVNNPSTTVTVDGNKTVTVNFELIPPTEYTLTMAVNPAGGGTTDPAVGPHVYVEGSEVPVTATPTAGWQFVNWTGDVADVNSPSTMVTVDGNKTVTANFELIPPTEYTLTMAVNPAGGGTTDPAVGPHGYVEGTEVPVTATPTAGWQFVNWTGDVADVNSPSTMVTVDGNKTVTANFELIPPTEYTLTMAVNPAGGGTTDPAAGPHGYVEGTEVPVTATPAAGWQFVNWSGDVADVNNPSTTVTVDGNKTVTANFELIPPTEYTLTMAVNPAGGGTTDPAVGPHVYVEGTEVPVTATPTAGWQFMNWTGDVADVNSPSTTVTVDGNKTVTANFELIPPTEYTLTMAVNPAGGGTTDPAVGPHGYVEGTEVPVTATPTAGWQFVNWTGDVADVNSPSTMVTVDGNKTVTANFELIPPTEYTLTMAVNPAGGGTTDPAAGPHGYVEGTEVPVTATPAAGWQFVNWTGDVADVNSPSTTVTVDGNKTVTANFKLIPPVQYTLTMAVNPAKGGSTDPAVGDHVYVEGTDVTITATANPGWQFMKWAGDVADAKSAQTTVTIDTDKEVMAKFCEIPRLAVEPANRDVDQKEGTTTFVVKSNKSWTVSENEKWLSVTPTDGKGDGTLTIAYEKNGSADKRIGKITLSGAGLTVDVTVTQAGTKAYLTAEPTNRDVDHKEGTTTFDVKSNISWTVSENEKWLSVTPTDGKGDGTLTIAYEKNGSADKRIGKITLSGAGLMVDLTVNQAGAKAYLTVEPTNRDVGPKAGTTRFDVKSNVSWEVSEKEDWLSVVIPKCTKDGEIVLIYEENPSIDQRIGKLTVSGGGLTVEVMVTQAGTAVYLTVEPENRDVGAEAGKTTFDVTSNISWTVNENEKWLSVKPANGSGDGTLTVEYNKNSSVDKRIGKLILSGSGLTVEVTVTQSGENVYLTAEPANRDVDHKEGTTTFDIKSNISWTVSENEKWLSVTPADGKGDGTLTVAYEKNGSVDKRSGKITLSGAGLKVDVTVTQAGTNAYLTAEPANRDVGAEAGKTTFDVKSNISWTFSENEEWLSVTRANGKCDVTLIVEYDKNDSLHQRIGKITLSGAGLTVDVTVTQAGTNAYLTAEPEKRDVDHESGKTTFIVKSNVDWIATESLDWLSVSPANGNRDGTLTVNYDENSEKECRTGHIIINGNGIETKLTVRQKGAPCLTVTPPICSIGSESSDTTLTIQSNLEWTVEVSESWVFVTPMSGSGDENLSLHFEDNTDLEPRTAIIKIMSGDFNVEVEVSQSSVTSLANDMNQLPTDYQLDQNYPNPFNPSTTIGFTLTEESDVTLEVYNTSGQIITTLVAGKLRRGYHSIVWNAGQMPTGVYFYRLTAKKFQDIKKMILTK